MSAVAPAGRPSAGRPSAGRVASERSEHAYRDHSLTSDPGRMASWIADAPRDIVGIHDLTTRLVCHYRAGGDPLDHGFTADRLDEIDLRYADDMLARLQELQPGSITAEREPTSRILGCCRDFTLLFVTLARAAGIPARSRIGFAGYFFDGWWIDHVVAEVWDAAENRWRLVDAQLPEGFPDVAGTTLDVLDLPRDRFLVGPDAWRAARAGELDHDRFAVAPEIDLPFLRSWGYLVHNLIVDLAAVNRDEVLLWESWGVLDVISASDPASVPDDATAARFDALADAMTAPDIDVNGFARLYAGDLVMPETITRLSPYDGSTREVTLRSAPAV